VTSFRHNYRKHTVTNRYTETLQNNILNLGILKMYLYTQNEVAKLRHSKLLTVDEICMANEKNTKIALKVKGQRSRSNVTNYQIPLCGETHRQTDTEAGKNNTCSQHAHR